MIFFSGLRSIPCPWGGGSWNGVIQFCQILDVFVHFNLYNHKKQWSWNICRKVYVQNFQRTPLTKKMLKTSLYSVIKVHADKAYFFLDTLVNFFEDPPPFGVEISEDPHNFCWRYWNIEPSIMSYHKPLCDELFFCNLLISEDRKKLLRKKY